MSILTTPNAAGACVDGPFNSLSHEALGRQQLEARRGWAGVGWITETAEVRRKREEWDMGTHVKRKGGKEKDR